MTPTAKLLRDAVIAAVEAVPDGRLCLSGGVDSATVLAASLALGRRPHCMTFQFGNFRSADVASATAMATALDLPFEIIHVPNSTEDIVRDARRVMSITGQATKVHVQVSIPFDYLSRAAKASGSDALIIGMAADDLWGTLRKAAVIQHQEGAAAFAAFRREQFNDPTASDWSVVKVAAANDVRVFDPWRDPALAELMFGLNWSDMHRPKPKALALRAFPEFWSGRRWFRLNSSLQVASGIRSAHDATLLADPAINTGGHKAVVAVYRDLMKQ